ncbi:Hsp20/alpha crystallin family protein [Thermodesulfobacteriota bacterium]
MFMRRVFDRPFETWRSPFEELEAMRRRLDTALEVRAGTWPWAPTAGVFPLMNVTESHDFYFVRAELPGVAARDIEITTTGKTLSLSGDRKIPAVEGASYHRKERRQGTFNRMLTLPKDIDTDKVEARFAGGVLTVVLPKAETAKPKKITVATS